MSDPVAQEIFDKAAKHLLTQGVKATSIDEAGYEVCSYRTADGLMCGVGCLFPSATDDEIRLAEGNSVTHPVVLKLLPAAYRDHKALLTLIQAIHDGHPAWYAALITLAFERGLSNAVVVDFGNDVG